MSSTLSAALTYARHGWPIVHLYGKRPHMEGWQHLNVTDEVTIRSWWEAEPDGNVGLATGHAFDVIDLDGPEGLASIENLEAEHGPLPKGRRVRTGSGGLHIYVTPIPGARNGVRILPGVDYRALGGQVVAPPSIHPDTGEKYRLIESGLPIIDPPLWLPALVLPKTVERVEPENVLNPASSEARKRGLAIMRKALQRVAAEANVRGAWDSTVNREAFLLMGLVKAGVLTHEEVYDGIMDAAAPWTDADVASVEDKLRRTYEDATPIELTERSLSDLIDIAPIDVRKAIMATYLPTGLATGPRH